MLLSSKCFQINKIEKNSGKYDIRCSDEVMQKKFNNHGNIISMSHMSKSAIQMCTRLLKIKMMMVVVGGAFLLLNGKKTIYIIKRINIFL